MTIASTGADRNTWRAVIVDVSNQTQNGSRELHEETMSYGWSQSFPQPLSAFWALPVIRFSHAVYMQNHNPTRQCLWAMFFWLSSPSCTFQQTTTCKWVWPPDGMANCLNHWSLWRRLLIAFESSASSYTYRNHIESYRNAKTWLGLCLGGKWQWICCVTRGGGRGRMEIWRREGGEGGRGEREGREGGREGSGRRGVEGGRGGLTVIHTLIYSNGTVHYLNISHVLRNNVSRCLPMEAQYLKNNHVTYYVITQVGVHAAQQWYVLRPTWRGTAGESEWVTDKVLEAGVQTSYVHSSMIIN